MSNEMYRTSHYSTYVVYWSVYTSLHNFRPIKPNASHKAMGSFPAMGSQKTRNLGGWMGEAGEKSPQRLWVKPHVTLNI